MLRSVPMPTGSAQERGRGREEKEGKEGREGTEGKEGRGWVLFPSPCHAVLAVKVCAHGVRWRPAAVCEP